MTAYTGTDGAPSLEPLAVMMVVSSAMCMTIPAREDRFKAAGFACSLPVSRRRIVLARYLLPVLLFPLLLVFIVLLHAAVRGFRFPAEVLRPGSVLLLLAVYLLTLGVFYPFTVRFGFLGLMVGLVTLQVLSIALLALATRGARGSVVALAAGFSSLLRSLEAAVGSAAYLGIVLAALLALYAISFLVSDAVFRRKDL